MKINIHPEADEEFKAAKRRYDEKLEGLGNRLVDEVELAYQLIKDNMEIGVELESGLRRIVLNKFPFSIFYQKGLKGIYVLAIAHHRRKPGYWHDRT